MPRDQLAHNGPTAQQPSPAKEHSERAVAAFLDIVVTHHQPLAMPRLYSYVGPAHIWQSIDGARGWAVATRANLATWVATQGEPSVVVATYVVDDEMRLRVASRRSEHVACAGGHGVFAAGELMADATGEALEISNQFTGYCPEPDCWDALKRALIAAAIPHPSRWTASLQFRKCDSCGQRCIVKDDWFECEVCGAALPAQRNF